MPAQTPIVCFVTPLSQNAKSVKLFKAFLDGLREDKFSWNAFGANYDNGQLDKTVSDAWAWVTSQLGTPPFSVPVVFVAGGTLAASALASNHDTGTYPIVQAAGGSIPSNAPANMKGFYLNDPKAKTICQQQYDTLKPTATKKVAVLYDSTNDNATQDILKSLKDYATQGTYTIVDIAGNINTLTTAALKGNTSFMLIPSALFYESRDTIAKTVEDAGLDTAIYPEREYITAHSNRTGKQVLGHKLALTFALAAYWVDSLLNGASIDTLKWQEAYPDPDP